MTYTSNNIHVHRSSDIPIIDMTYLYRKQSGLHSQYHLGDRLRIQNYNVAGYSILYLV